MLLLILVLVLVLVSIAVSALISLPAVDVAHVDLSTCQIDINTALVWLSVILQAKLITNLLDSGFDFLDMSRTVVAFTDNDVQVGLASALSILYTFFKDILCFFNELPMQIDRIGGNPVLRIILTENKFRSLLVVLLHLCTMSLSFIRESLCCSSITAIVCFLGFLEAITALAGLLAREIPQAIVFFFRFAGIVVIKC